MQSVFDCALPPADLFSRVTFHDSSLESIQYDPDGRRLRLEIDFCFWMQPGYRCEDPETGRIALLFGGVREYVQKLWRAGSCL